MLAITPVRVERTSHSATAVPRARQQRRMTRVTLCVTLVAGLGAAVFGFTSGSTVAKHPLRGTLTLTAREATGNPCTTTPASADLGDGAEITVRDAAGQAVGAGHLGKGEATSSSCIRPIEIGAVPVLPEYRLVIGNRAPFVITADALRASGGVIDLRFGS
jgi:hypothetical protein